MVYSCCNTWKRIVLHAILAHAIISHTMASSINTPIHLKHSLPSLRYPFTSGNDGGDDGPSQSYDSLTRWLENLRIRLPDETFHKGIFSVSLQNLTCTQYHIRAIESSYNDTTAIPTSRDNKGEDPNHIGPSLEMTVYGVSATCLGMYRSGITSGTVEIHLTSNRTQEDTNKQQSNNKYNNGDDDYDDHVDDFDDETIVLQMTVPSTVVNWNTTSSPYEIYPKYLLHHSHSHTLPDNMKIPISFNVTTCFIQHLHVPIQNGIIFTGSISATIMELFSTMIAKRITESMMNQLCPALALGIESILTQQVIQPMNTYLLSLITNTTAVTVTHNRSSTTGTHNNTIISNETITTRTTTTTTVQDPSFIQWDTDVPVLKHILHQFNQIVSQHMNQGFLLAWLLNHDEDDDALPSCFTKQDDCGYFFQGVNGFIRHFSTDGKGIFILPSQYDDDNDKRNTSLFDVSIPIPSYGDIYITCLSLQMTGLDHLKQLIVADPYIESSSSSFPSLQTQFHVTSSSTTGWNVILDLYLRIHPTSDYNQDKILEERFQLHLQMSNISCTLILGLNIDKSQFENIRLGDLIHTLDFSTLSWIPFIGLKQAVISDIDIYTDIDTLEIHPHGNLNRSFLFTLENDFDNLIDTVTKVILHEYDIYVTQAIHALISEPIRSILNSKLEKYILNATTKAWITSGEIKNDDDIMYRHFSAFNRSFIPGNKFHWNMTNISLDKLNQYIDCIWQVLTLAINQTIVPLSFIKLWNDELVLNINSWQMENTEHMFKQIGAFYYQCA